MHKTDVKIIEAQQASLCNSYKNTKLKLLKLVHQLANKQNFNNIKMHGTNVKKKT
jgi:hypothetical protein